MVQASLILTITLSTNCQLYGKKIWMTNMSAIQHNSAFRGGHEMFAHQNPFFFCMPRSQREDLKKHTHFHCKTNMATLCYKSPYPLSHVILCSSNPNTQLVCPMPRSREDLSILKKKSLHYIYGQVPRVTEQPLPLGSLNVTMF